MYVCVYVSVNEHVFVYIHVCMHISSIKGQKGAFTIQRCSVENQKSAFAIDFVQQ